MMPRFSKRPFWAHFSRYERVLSMRYPFGIVKNNKSTQSKKHKIRVLFISSGTLAKESSPFSGPEGELLAKAVTQGLKWQLSEVALAFASQFKSYKELLSFVKKLDPICIVLLGKQSQALIEGGNVNGWIMQDSYNYLASADIRDALNDVGIKRLFWNDLKQVEKKVTAHGQ
jgi:hypothetical protein